LHPQKKRLLKNKEGAAIKEEKGKNNQQKNEIFYLIH